MAIVIAIGANIFPSIPSRESKGINTKIMMPTPNRTGLPTSVAASKMILFLDSPDLRRSPSLAKVFSTTTTEPSTMMPIAIAKPPRDIKLAEIPYRFITKNVSSGVNKSVATTMSEERTSPKNKNSKIMTRITPSISTFATLNMAAFTRSVLS